VAVDEIPATRWPPSHECPNSEWLAGLSGEAAAWSNTSLRSGNAGSRPRSITQPTERREPDEQAASQGRRPEAGQD